MIKRELQKGAKRHLQKMICNFNCTITIIFENSKQSSSNSNIRIESKNSSNNKMGESNSNILGGGIC
jgi:hypothetical protein